MPSDFQGELLAQLGWRWTDEAVSDESLLRYTRRVGSGAAPVEAEAVWYEQNVTLADGVPRTLDLTALQRWLFDDVLQIALVSVRALMVVNHSAAAACLTVGGAAGDEWSGPFADAGQRLVVPGQGVLLLAAPAGGWPVDAANRHLRLAASGGTVSYSIALLGTLAIDAPGSGID